MPHKIYMCCDSNTCTCGRQEKLYGGFAVKRDSEPDDERYNIDDVVRIAGGKDEYRVIDNEAHHSVTLLMGDVSVQIPKKIVILVRRAKTDEEKYDYAIQILQAISRSGKSAGLATVIESATQALIDLGEDT